MEEWRLTSLPSPCAWDAAWVKSVTSRCPNQAVDAALQVNPGGTNNGEVEAGWYGALAKKYPQAIKKFGTGAQNNPSILEPIEKWEKTAEAQGYKVVDFQEPPLTVSDWTPYVQEAQTKGVEALEPSDDSAIAPYLQAMNTAGYKPPSSS